jgi:peroxiredoxin
MPAFAEWQKQYGSGNFQVIGISMDDATPEVIATVSRLKLNYPVLMGDEYLGDAYGGVLGLPVTFLIDRDGKIQDRYQGASLTRIKDDIQNLLQSNPSEPR